MDRSEITAWLRTLEARGVAYSYKASKGVFQHLWVHVERVREEERKRIAREIHDELGQALLRLRMDVSLLQLELGEIPSSARERLRSMKATADRSIGIARNVMSGLRPAVLERGLTAALEWLLDDFNRWSEIQATLCIVPRGVVLPEDLSLALFRIAQESLTNAQKHAAATAVHVALEVDGHEVMLGISDNGKGFSVSDVDRTSAFGLAGIRERVMMLGGELEVRSGPNEGTCVRVRLPIMSGFTAAHEG